MPLSSPDGDPSAIWALASGAENGIADVTAPINCLLGVFLGPDQPDATLAPSALDFSTPASRDYVALSPALKQPFFIGDGRTSSNTAQTIVVPDGATRLFLGTMDHCFWADNDGAFTVDVARGGPPYLTIEVADVCVCWPSLTNITYQVEYRSDVAGSAWLPLGSPLVGTGITNCITDSVRGQPRRFYRLVEMP